MVNVMQHVLRSYAQVCNALCMTTSTIHPQVPRWDLTDRLGKSMREARFSVHDMADYFEVHRNTVSGWLHGRIKPDTRTLRLWASVTSVPYEWLRYGEEPDDGPSNGDGGGQQIPSPVVPLFSHGQPVVKQVRQPAEIQLRLTA